MSEERAADLWISLGFALIGGYADAASFVLTKTFTGHVTGNLVLTMVSLVSEDWHTSLRRLAAVACFLAGSILGIALQRSVTKIPVWSALRVSVSLEIAFVVVAYFAMLTQEPAKVDLAVCALCVALGVQNGVWQQVKGIGIHTTYLTGTVTTLMTKKYIQGHSQASKSGETEKSSEASVLAKLLLAFLIGSAIGAGMAFHFRAAAVLGLVPPLLVTLVARPSADK